MKSLTVRLPDRPVAEIEAESRKRSCPKSEVVRERLQRGASPMGNASAGFNLIADLIGYADGLPADLSRRKKSYLRSLRYGRKPAR